jgi:hypothetical protein
MSKVSVFGKDIKENSFFILLAYWVTFFIVRGGIYGSLMYYGKSPAIYFQGIHVHHFFTGFMILLFVLAYYFFREEAGRLWFLIFGVSLGLIFDEFTFWTELHFDYWTIGNFLAVYAMGVFLLFLFLLSRKTEK